MAQAGAWLNLGRRRPCPGPAAPGVAEAGLLGGDRLVDRGEGGAGSLAFGSDVDAGEDRLVEDASLERASVAVDAGDVIESAEGNLERVLNVLELGCGGGLEAFGGSSLFLELVLLGGEDGLGYEVAVVELYELGLLVFDGLQGLFVAF